jgi:hypothetical protein
MRSSSVAESGAKLPLSVRRERALARIERARFDVASSWDDLARTVAGRERGVLAVTQTLSTAVKLGAAAAAVWMAGRIRGPRALRRGLMLLAAARATGRLLARAYRERGSRWQNG